jgi:hypothetical protein
MITIGFGLQKGKQMKRNPIEKGAGFLAIKSMICFFIEKNWKHLNSD